MHTVMKGSVSFFLDGVRQFIMLCHTVFMCFILSPLLNIVFSQAIIIHPVAWSILSLSLFTTVIIFYIPATFSVFNSSFLVLVLVSSPVFTFIVLPLHFLLSSPSPHPPSPLFFCLYLILLPFPPTFPPSALLPFIIYHTLSPLSYHSLLFRPVFSLLCTHYSLSGHAPYPLFHPLSLGSTTQGT